MTSKKPLMQARLVVAVSASLLVLSSPGFTEENLCPISADEFIPDPNFTSSFMLENCTFRTRGVNPYFILKPGYRIVLESDEELVQITVLEETEVVDGVGTRVVEEREWEKDGEELILDEVSRNFFAICRQTNAVIYFGEDSVDGEGNLQPDSWRAGVNGAKPGLIMPGTILLGSRYYQEIAPENEALDKGQIVRMQDECRAGGHHFEDCIRIIDTSDCEPGERDPKVYAKGVGIVRDEDLKIVSFGFVDLEDEKPEDD